MKKALLFVLSAAMLLSLFAGCSDTNSATETSSSFNSEKQQGSSSVKSQDVSAQQVMRQLPEGALVIQKQGNFSTGT